MFPVSQIINTSIQLDSVSVCSHYCKLWPNLQRVGDCGHSRTAYEGHGCVGGAPVIADEEVVDGVAVIELGQQLVQHRILCCLWMLVVTPRPPAMNMAGRWLGCQRRHLMVHKGWIRWFNWSASIWKRQSWWSWWGRWWWCPREKLDSKASDGGARVMLWGRDGIRRLWREKSIGHCNRYGWRKLTLLR